MGAYLTILVFLLTPVWAWWLWRRMKKVQRLANEKARAPERHNVDSVEDEFGQSNGLKNARILSYNDDLALAEKLANAPDSQKDLEGRKH